MELSITVCKQIFNRSTVGMYKTINICDTLSPEEGVLDKLTLEV